MPPKRRGQSPMEASVRKVVELAQALKPDYLQCRDYGHSWRAYTAYREGTQFVRVLECRSCFGLKSQRISRNGQLLHTVMKYPKDYLFVGVGRIVGSAKDAMRLTSLQADLLATAEKEKIPET